MSYTATNLLYDLNEGNKGRLHSQYGGSARSTAAGAVGGAFPRTFGNMLFSHSAAAVPSTADAKAPQQNMHVSMPCGGSDIARFAPHAQQAPGYAWGSVEGGTAGSISGVLPFATISEPKVQQLPLHAPSSVWDELASPGVLPPTPHLNQQQSHRSTVSIVAYTISSVGDSITGMPAAPEAAGGATPVAGAQAACLAAGACPSNWEQTGSAQHVALRLPASTASSVAFGTTHDGVCHSDEHCMSEVQPAAAAVEQHAQAMQHKCLLDGTCWEMSEDGNAAGSPLASVPQLDCAAAAALELAATGHGHTVGDVTLSAGMAEQLHVKWQASQARQHREEPQQQPQFRTAKQMHGSMVHRRRKKEKPKGPPSPPFLTYKAPEGWRDWCIVGLLIAVAAPSVAILLLVSWGTNNGRPELYFEGEQRQPVLPGNIEVGS
jgi:hypothetical protein